MFSAEQRARKWRPPFRALFSHKLAIKEMERGHAIVCDLLAEIDRLRQQSGNTGEFDRGWNAAIEAALNTHPYREEPCTPYDREWNDGADCYSEHIAALRKGGEK